eukprot:TRINITY_DN20623_c0_g1_i2.p1 TRINITY_DN20623_c0_g1~~TRINITY_DN20623_c0_g1_i2.p1  ORF type:complete len:771 (-),score=111.29 TRINITY_DN20623_c0_g1_i2:442-2709(-)
MAPDTSLSELLERRFKVINQVLDAQHDRLRTEVLSWQENYLAGRRESAKLEMQQENYLPTRKESAKSEMQQVDIEDDDSEIQQFDAKPGKVSHRVSFDAGTEKLASEQGRAPTVDGSHRDEDHAFFPAPSNQRSASKSTVLSILPGSVEGEEDHIDAANKHIQKDDEEVAATLLRRPTASRFQSSLRSNTLKAKTSEVLRDSRYGSGPMNLEVHPIFARPSRQLRLRFRKGSTAAVDRIFSMAIEDTDTPKLTWQDNFVVLPGSLLNIFWESLGILIVLYDFVVLPLQFLSDEELLPSFNKVAVHCMRVYWTLDIGMGFVASYNDPKTGKPELDVRRIAWRYATRTMSFDLVLVLSDWLIVLIEGGRSAFVVRFARLVRLLRLVRLFQFIQKILVFITLRIRSDAVLIVIELMKVFISCLMWMHPMACCFYGLGRLDNGGWIHHYGVTDGNIWSRYIHSCYWSVSQLTGDANLTPQNTTERVFAIVVLLLAFVLSALIISNLTTLMTQLQQMTAEKKRQVSILQMYLSDNFVSPRLATRIIDYVAQSIEEQRRTPPEEMVELLSELSIPLQTELHFDIYTRFLTDHPFFCGYVRYNPRGMRAVCHTAVVKCKTAQGDVLFSSGESLEHPQMYMLIGGKLEYIFGDEEKILSPGKYVNEAALWMPWPQQLGTLRAHEDGQVLCVQSIPFQYACEHFQTESFYPAQYAQQFVAAVNALAHKDILETWDAIDGYQIANSVFPRFSKDNASKNWSSVWK